MRLFPALLAALILIGGCSTPTLTPEDCALGAWVAVGRDDGLQGLNSTRVKRHNDACSKQDIQVNSSEYMLGYREGIKQYCDAYDHYRAGVSGEDHVANCVGEPYAGEHRKGLTLYCENFDHYGLGLEGQPSNQRCPGSDYQEGYSEGIAQYCSQTNPFELGRKNAGYSRVCSNEFARAYTLGRQSADLDLKIDRTDDQLVESIRRLIDEEDPEKAQNIRENIGVLERQLKQQRKDQLGIKLEARDLGYLDSDDLLEDLIELAL